MKELKFKSGKNLILLYGKDILESQNFNKSRTFIQHGNYSVRLHSINVAKTSLIISHLIPIRFSEKELVRGALLHDYFLYDWHKKKVGVREIGRFYEMHGFTHPKVAARNAKKDFHTTAIENEIIKKHMWPLTLKPPACREAWVVTMADKYCSLCETILRKRGDIRG